ncbi:MAG: TRAP transporter substrate-binding protein [Planctomycetota bacterium]
MQRRDFLTSTIAAGAALGVTGCSPSSAGPAVRTQPHVRWRLASSFPRSLDTIFGAAEVLSRRVDELTEGRFKIAATSPGEVLPALEVLDGVRQNAVEVAHSASYYFIGKEPALAFDCAVPFGLTARQQCAWLTQAGGRELLQKHLFDPYDVLHFPGGNTGVQMGGWFVRPLHSLTDLNGLKMRIPGLGGQVMNRLGATPLVLPGGEIYTSLERGAIDATEWVGPYDDQKLGFHQVAKHYYYPGWWEPGPALTFYVSRSAWEKLPLSYQGAFTAAAAEAAHRMQMEYDAKNPPALASLVESGVQLHPFPTDILVAAEKAFDEYTADKVANSPTYRTIHEHWSAYKRSSDRWFGTAEKGYLDFALRNR